MSMVERLNIHYQYAKERFNEDRIVGLFLAGSQNYGTNLESSDTDTKLIIVPSLDDIYKNKKGENITFNLPDDSGEQMSIKDIRCAISELKKQNINMLEILFTDYKIVNPIYENIWNELINNKEKIVRYNELSAVKTIKGIAANCYYKRLFTPEGKINCKQVANLVRLEYYLKKYINGTPYVECLRPQGEDLDYIMKIRKHEFGPAALQCIADGSIKAIDLIVDAYEKKDDYALPNTNIEYLLEDYCEEFINTALIKELAAKGVL